MTSPNWKLLSSYINLPTNPSQNQSIPKPIHPKTNPSQTQSLPKSIPPKPIPPKTNPFQNQSLPKYFLTYFKRISAAHNYCTRPSSNDEFVIPLFKTKRAQKSIRYQESKEWNSIPTSIQSLNFKKFSTTSRNKLLTTYEQ